MGHYRQYLIRGRGSNKTGDVQYDPLLAPIISAVAGLGGRYFTLTATPGNDPAWYMSLYYGPNPGAASIVADCGPVSTSPQTRFAADIYGNTYFSRVSSGAGGTGTLGPLSAMFTAP